MRLRIPFITGPAGCLPVSRPVGGLSSPLERLPFSEPGFALRRAG